jgi:hypothetical protein
MISVEAVNVVSDNVGNLKQLWDVVKETVGSQKLSQFLSSVKNRPDVNYVLEKVGQNGGDVLAKVFSNLTSVETAKSGLLAFCILTELTNPAGLSDKNKALENFAKSGISSQIGGTDVAKPEQKKNRGEQVDFDTFVAQLGNLNAKAKVVVKNAGIDPTGEAYIIVMNHLVMSKGTVLDSFRSYANFDEAVKGAVNKYSLTEISPEARQLLPGFDKLGINHAVDQIFDIPEVKEMIRLVKLNPIISLLEVIITGPVDANGQEVPNYQETCEMFIRQMNKMSIAEFMGTLSEQFKEDLYKLAGREIVEKIAADNAVAPSAKYDVEVASMGEGHMARLARDAAEKHSLYARAEAAFNNISKA